MMENGYSLSDIAAVAGEGFGNGGNALFIIILLLAFMNGGFGWGRNNGGDFGQYATAASQTEILLGQQFQGLDNKIDRIGNGIADATFALNNSIKDGTYSVSGTVVAEGRALQTQLAGYQLDSQKNIDSMRFDMANYANAINANIDSKVAAIEKRQMEATISAQAQRINELALAQQMCGVVRYPNGWTYNAGTSPFCNCCNSCCN